MSLTQRIYVTLMNPPLIIKRAMWIYLFGAMCFNVLGSYVDAKDHLLQYRAGNKDYFPTRYPVHNEWEAVKYGASANMYQRLFDSLVFPFTAASYIVPSLVLYLNAPDAKQEKDK